MKREYNECPQCGHRLDWAERLSLTSWCGIRQIAPCSSCGSRLMWRRWPYYLLNAGGVLFLLVLYVVRNRDHVWEWALLAAMAPLLVYGNLARGLIRTAALPAAGEINPYNDLEGHTAVQHFLGRSLEEAEALFRENSRCYQDDLLHMGPDAFNFYFPAVVGYVKSPAATGDAGIIDGLCNTLEHRLRQDGESLQPATAAMTELCRHVLDDYDRFQVDEAGYSDLRPRYHGLLERLEATWGIGPSAKGA